MGMGFTASDPIPTLALLLRFKCSPCLEGEGIPLSGRIY